MITKLVAFDFDKTLFATPEPEEGRLEYRIKKGIDFPQKGWWSSPASLDLDVFDIKPYNVLVNILAKEAKNPSTMVIILTSRVEELRPELEKILIKNNINVDGIYMNDHDKGERLFDFLRWERDIKTIDVYDDRDKDINSYLLIKKHMPSDIVFNIFRADKGNVNLVENKLNLSTIINEEIGKLVWSN